MIRPIVIADTPDLVALSEKSGLFKRDDLGAIQKMLDDYHSTHIRDDHNIIAFDDSGALIGMAYFAPKAFTDRVWELLMIAVDESKQRQGIGSALLVAVEDIVRRLRGRLLLIETSDTSSFERTRQFYRKHAYSEVARIADYFADGDGKASFIKRV